MVTRDDDEVGTAHVRLGEHGLEHGQHAVDVGKQGDRGHCWSKSADVTAALFCSTRTIQLPELSRHTASIP